MKSKTTQELQEQNKLLRDLLMESIPALCTYRAMKGFCAKCNDSYFCRAKNIIPKIEHILQIHNDGTIFKQ